MEEVLGGFAQMLRAAQKKYREFVRERKIDRSVMPDPKSSGLKAAVHIGPPFSSPTTRRTQIISTSIQSHGIGFNNCLYLILS